MRGAAASQPTSTAPGVRWQGGIWLRRASLFVVGSLVLFVLAILAGYCLNFLGDPVNRANYRRIAAGMTEQEVESLLGWGQEYSDRPDFSDFQGTQLTWCGDEYSVVVWFDEDGRVVHKKEYEWVPWKAWDQRSWDERVYRFFRLELGPPRFWRDNGMWRPR